MEARMKKLFRVCLLLSVFWTSALKAQDPPVFFNWLTMKDGLSHNCVNKAIEDKNGFIWFATNDGLDRYDGHTFKTFIPFETIGNTKIPVNYIVSLCEDGSGNIWVGTISGLFRFDLDKESFSKVETKTKEGESITGKITDITIGKRGDIWIADYTHGLFRLSPSQNTLRSYNTKRNNLKSDDALTLCCDNDSTIWAGTLGMSVGGLNRFDENADCFIFNDSLFVGGVNKIAESGTNNLIIGMPKDGAAYFNRITGKSEELLSRPGQDIFVNDILTVGSTIWIGTSDGLYAYDRKTGNTRHFSSNPVKENSLSSNDITNILKDRDGGLWFCTLSKGVNYLPDNYQGFELYPSSYDTNFKDGQIKSFAQDKDGNIWLANNKGLSLFNPKTRQFLEPSLGKAVLNGDNITTILISDNSLWIGYLGKGLDRINLKTCEITRFPSRGYSENSLNDNSVMSLCEDNEGNLLIGSTRGANILYADDSRIGTLLKGDDNQLVSDIIEDHNLNIWMSSYGHGVHILNPRTQEWRELNSSSEKNECLVNNQVTGLFEDSRKDVWILTDGGGLFRISGGDKKTTSFTRSDGLPNDIIQKTLEDDSGCLWISTNNGLSRYNPKNNVFTNYSFSGGPLSNQFLHNSGLKDSDGYMYFGTPEGFVRFKPESIKTKRNDAPVFFTDLFLDNRSVKVGEKGSPLQRSIVNSDKIILPHKQNSIRLTFAELDHQESSTRQFSYKLENYDTKWQTARDNQISYSNLPGGKYRLIVINTDNIGNESSANSRALAIIVKPNPLMAWWARLIYFLLFSAAATLLFLSFKKRQSEKKIRMLEELKSKEEKAAYDTKLAFYTGIAHEIRTPLSLVASPFEIITSPNATQEDKASCAEVMKENLNRLTELTRQMLDISIIERDGVILNKIPADINDLIESLLKSYQLSLRQNDIHLERQLCEKHIIAMVDKEQFLKIVSNLLSNAAKYSKGNIRVKLERKNDSFALSVWNNGPSIAPEFTEKIFETFYQVPGSQKLGGVGVGLSLVKTFVEMHQGKVYVNPEIEKGVEFVVELPIGEEVSELPELDLPDKTQDSNETQNITGDTTILIVDDNKSMTKFLRNLIGKQYHAITANDGNSAINALRAQPVDLVISDIMMNDIDGITLCKVIKNHEEFNNIPVILLTAKTDLKSKVAGVDAGADAYIEKPFSTELLMAQINSVLKNRKNYKQSSLDSALKYVKDEDFTAKDERFLKKLYEIIDKKLSDQNLDVNLLSEEMHISRSNLYRIIKKATGLNPGELIKNVRLEKAEDLLRKGNMRISEVGYTVGYTSSSYFAKSFLKKYGSLPKDYAKRMQNNETEK